MAAIEPTDGMLDADHVSSGGPLTRPVLRCAPHPPLTAGSCPCRQPIMDRVQFALEKQLKGAYDISKLKLSEQVTFRAT